MGRKPVFTEAQMLAAAAAEVARHGPRASVVGVAKSLGAPSGSVYHRFPTRDALIAAAWLDALRNFQSGFLTALTQPDLDEAAVAAATHVPKWCGRHLDRAILLHSFRLEDLVDVWPEPLTPQRDGVNEELHRALRQHAHDRYGRATGVALELTTFALVNVPGAAVRRFLDQRRTPPRWSIDAVAAATLAILRSHP
jgi:AcrR family transcriptional regulator